MIRRPVPLAVLALPLVLAACTTSLAGHGTPGAGAAGAVGTSSSGATAPGTGSAAPSTGAPTTPAGLAGRLETPPAGSDPWTSAWAALRTPTVAQFVQHVYASTDQADARSHLEAQGLTGIAHRTWYAADSCQADDVLLGFATAGGAQSRFLSASAAQEGGGRTRVTVDGVDDAVGFTDPALDSLGNSRTVFYAQRGSVVFELFYFSPATYKAADARTWLTAQVKLLG